MSQISAISSLSGLVAYWPCDETTGSTIADVTNSPANATLSGAGGYLAPWNSPGGVGAVGLRPYSAAAINVGVASKLNVGDNFTIGTFFRRRAAVTGTLFSRGTLYAALGSELFTDPGMESALIAGATGGWSTSQGGGGGSVDTSVFHGGTQSYRIDVNASNTVAAVSQGIPNAQPGRYTLTFWYRNDAVNTNGRMDVQITYVPASGGAQKSLQLNTTDVWSTTSQDVLELPYITTFTQRSLTFDLPEAAGSGTNSLKIAFKRKPGAGGGVAYSLWVDDASLKYQPTSAGAYAVKLGSDGIVSCVAGTGAEARTIATSNPAAPITDHLGWHSVILTKGGSTTKLYIDGVDQTVTGTNTTIASASHATSIFSGTDYGTLPVVGGHVFVANRAISSAEQAAIYNAANMLPDKAADPQIKVGFSQYAVAPNFAINFPNAAAAMRGAHATVVREMFPWSYIEATQGVRTWTSYDNLVNAYVAQGLSVYAVFEPSSPSWAASGRTVPGSITKGISVADANNNATNGGAGTNAYTIWRNRFTDYIVAFVNRYKDRVHIWEIGNEENSSIFWAPAASAPLFIDFYNYGRAAILAELGADAPNHQIVLGGFARHRSEQGTTDANSYTADEFLRALLDGGISQIDRCAAHPYVSNNAGPYTHTVGGNNFDTLHQMRDTLMEYGKQPIVELNEHGWYTANSYVAAGSNGLTLPQANIQVQDATKFNTSDPTLWIETSLGFQAIGHTGISGNTLTGCTGGAGVISTGGRISFGNVPVSEATQAQYVTDGIKVTRDYFSAFCDTYLYFCGFQHQINNRDAFSFNSAWQGTDFVTPKAMVATFSAASLPFERLQYAMGGNFTGSVAMGVNGTWKTVSDHKLSRATGGTWSSVL